MQWTLLADFDLVDRLELIQECLTYIETVTPELDEALSPLLPGFCYDATTPRSSTKPLVVSILSYIANLVRCFIYSNYASAC